MLRPCCALLFVLCVAGFRAPQAARRRAEESSSFRRNRTEGMTEGGRRLDTMSSFRGAIIRESLQAYKALPMLEQRPSFIRCCKPD